MSGSLAGDLRTQNTKDTNLMAATIGTCLFLNISPSYS